MERSLEEVFELLFPTGPDADDLILELAPDGWEQSEFFFAFHPTPEQIEKWPRMSRLKTLNQPVRPGRECAVLIGLCLREVFAGHDVTAPYPIDEGTWRSTGHDIAAWLNRTIDGVSFDYMDFYMGPYDAQEVAELTPVYTLIFRRFQEHGFDFLYTYPQFYVANRGTDDDLAYKAHLETVNAEKRKEIDQGPVPSIMAAYRNVFGKLPGKSEPLTPEI